MKRRIDSRRGPDRLDNGQALDWLRKLNAVTSAVSGAVAATEAIMAAAEVSDNSILLGLFLLPPGALAGWLLWRLGFQPAA